MKTIAVIGDSHTWGEGAEGYQSEFTENSPLEPGCLWLMSFSIPNYVNQFRNKINTITNSEAREDRTIHALPYRFKTDAQVIRMQFFTDHRDGSAAVKINGILKENLVVKANQTPREYVTVTLKNQGVSLIELEGDAKLFRVEEYGGEYAVVNCGVGGCPTFRYLDEYWDKRVAPLDADYFLIEPCTINDWLSGNSPGEYYKTTSALLKRASETGKVLVLTVSPIMGSQLAVTHAGEHVYDEFIAESKRAAEALGLPVADANHRIKSRLSGLSEEQQRKLMFSDPWHPNHLGHTIYAETAFEKFTACFAI